MSFTALNKFEKQRLLEALQNNAEKALLMSKDTSFLGTTDVTDDEVIDAVKSVSCHY